MSSLLSKSQENKNAASMLISNKYYAASVHCSFYSSLQLMLHILKEKYQISNAYEISKAENTGTHLYATKQIKKKLKDKNRKSQAREFGILIHELKILRVKSDYQEEIIDMHYSAEANRKMTSINTILTTIFLQS